MTTREERAQNGLSPSDSDDRSTYSEAVEAIDSDTAT